MTPTAQDTEQMVLLVEVAATLGSVPEFVVDRLAAFGLELGRDWADRPAVRVSDARELVSRLRQDRDAHDTRWQAYQQYLVEAEQAARAKEQAARDEAKRKSDEANRRRSEEDQKVRAEKASREAAERARKQQEKKGQPTPWDTFAKSGPRWTAPSTPAAWRRAVGVGPWATGSSGAHRVGPDHSGRVSVVAPTPR